MKVTNTKSRNIYFDLLKGIAIILVAYGHVLQTFNSDWESSSIGKTIYAFHMPLFMLISGYFFLSECSKNRYDTLYKETLYTSILAKFDMGTIFLFSNRGGANYLAHSISILNTLSI